MNVIHIGVLPPHPAGSAFRDGELLDGLAELGHDVTAAALTYPDRMTLEPSGLSPRVRTARLVVPGTGMLTRLTAALVLEQETVMRRWLSVHLRDHRPDVFLAQSGSATGGFDDLLRRHGTAIVILQHGIAVVHGSLAVQERLRTALRAADLVICCADHVVGALAGIGVERAVAIPNGVDVARFRPAPPDPALRQKLGVAADATIALHVSSLRPSKRVEDLIESAALDQGDPRLVYLIAGDGPDREALERTIRDRGLAERFCFTRWVRRDRMAGHLALADMVVMPSGTEGMSLTCLEAMACGRLVIASDIPGSREIIRDGETGLLFRLGDAADLAAKILRAARDPELRARIGRAARAHVEKHHRLEDMITRYAEILEELVDRRSARAT